MGVKITDWELFEVPGDVRNTNKFRAGLDYLQLPTSYSSDKLMQLLGNSRSGLAAFGLWILLAEVWASQKRAKRDGGIIWSWEDGRPASNSELAKKLHLPKRLLDTLCPLLYKVKWIDPHPKPTMEILGKDDGNTAVDIDSLYKKKKDKDQDIDKDKDKVQVRSYVKITQIEIDKLVAKYGQENTEKLLDKLDNYKGAKGKYYKDDYRAILSWVVEAVLGPNPEPAEPEESGWLKVLREEQEKVDAAKAKGAN